VDIKLSFKITFNSGETTTQEISIQADPRHAFDSQAKALMQQMLGQYASIGMLQQPEPGKYRLILPSQLAVVECELPTILIASENEVPKVTLD
jgi:hypothetical protein